ncbi:MAG: methylated-DNA--[protein]-cysteine S-methyltransferase [Planctomycetota bacterium]|nr:MAG: methylated-DNA--[protein]-cysteine S-methyltransferase [Planctomycetota bacterium]
MKITILPKKAKIQATASFEYLSPLGNIYLWGWQDSLISLSFKEKPFPKDLPSSSTLEKAACQLEEYFSGDRREFHTSLLLQGTPFQIRVWRALLEIPYGKTCSYEEIAIQIGKPRACRAVGNSNGKNPIPIIIPCHRVVEKSGKLGGYSSGLEIKEKLLLLERKGRL